MAQQVLGNDAARGKLTNATRTMFESVAGVDGSNGPSQGPDQETLFW
jgi:hypothetical protein